MEGLFDHVEQPYNQLNARLGFLVEHIKRPLSEERKQAIRKEMACLTFELVKREQEIGLYTEEDLYEEETDG